MKADPELIKDSIERFARVARLFAALERQPFEFPNGELLYPSEAHFVEAVGDTPGLGVMDLSEKLGITKGAVSQLASKLERKGYLEKRRDPDHPKEVQITLTERGQHVYRVHIQQHALVDAAWLGTLVQEITPEQYAGWIKILGQIEQYLVDHLA